MPSLPGFVETICLAMFIPSNVCGTNYLIPSNVCGNYYAVSTLLNRNSGFTSTCSMVFIMLVKQRGNACYFQEKRIVSKKDAFVKNLTY